MEHGCRLLSGRLQPRRETRIIYRQLLGKDELTAVGVVMRRAAGPGAKVGW